MARQQPQQAEPEEEEQPATTSRKKMFILVGAGLMALLLSLGVVAWVFLSGDEEEVAETVAEPGQPMAIYQPLNPAFVVNYVHEGRPRYLQVSVVLMGRDQSGMEELTKHMPLIRNQLVMLFSSEDFSTLFSPEGKETLRERASLAVKALMEKELGNPMIETVLFTNFVLQ
ncbi:MAG TPA: flagellar basal body-associated protein FliL [Pseudomonas xinjiangensis]|uniref:Flagellar protein FliL n=2 Tax=root TaxID=1 RepID=A0A7V1BMA3_9GAMM|nr:flagellar basal body-associated protein FliL [Halopseudomonas xinjiangensis]HEC49131.1 flagellar basal body-associated protein FliL [Halopseudomonas xinjiangensis]